MSKFYCLCSISPLDICHLMASELHWIFPEFFNIFQPISSSFQMDLSSVFIRAQPRFSPLSHVQALGTSLALCPKICQVIGLPPCLLSLSNQDMSFSIDISSYEKETSFFSFSFFTIFHFLLFSSPNRSRLCHFNMQARQVF